MLNDLNRVVELYINIDFVWKYEYESHSRSYVTTRRLGSCSVTRIVEYKQYETIMYREIDRSNFKTEKYNRVVFCTLNPKQETFIFVSHGKIKCDYMGIVFKLFILTNDRIVAVKDCVIHTKYKIIDTKNMYMTDLSKLADLANWYKDINIS
jgi:hypothetical protein